MSCGPRFIAIAVAVLGLGVPATVLTATPATPSDSVIAAPHGDTPWG